MPEMTLVEGVRTLRAVREFTDEPVSDEAIRAILDLAVCAPSGGNRQPWEFVVVPQEFLDTRSGPDAT